jgi:hypothetical protein
MRRFGCWLVIGSLAFVASIIAAGPAAAAKGGNNDTAKRCQNGGWKVLASQMGQPFKNQGDCVNDGAQGLGVPPAPLDPQTVCQSLPDGSFTSGEGQEFIWDCSWSTPPKQSQTLSDACAQSGGFLMLEVFGGGADGTCTPSG